MVTRALFVRLEAKPGMEPDVENLLQQGLALVRDEPATEAWFAIRLSRSTFAIFDAFPDESGRQAHLAGRLAKTLAVRAADLFAVPPTIENADVIAVKTPELAHAE